MLKFTLFRRALDRHVENVLRCKQQFPSESDPMVLPFAEWQLALRKEAHRFADTALRLYRLEAIADRLRKLW